MLGFAVGLAACLYLRRLSRQQIDAIYPRLDQATLEAEALAQSALEDARARAAAQQAELLARREAALRGADEAYAARIEAITERRDGRLSGPVLEYPQKVEEITARRDRDLELAEQMRARRDAELRQKEAAGPQLETRYTRQVEQIEGRYLNQWQALGDEWQAGLARIESLVERIWSSNCPAAGRNWLADLGELAAGDWQAAAGVPPALRFGTFRVELSQIPHGVPHKSELAERGPTAFTLPALVAFPDRASLVFEARGPARQTAIEAVQATMLRLLVSIPPGKVRFTIIDPVGLGENFAAFMHLADYDEALVTSRIWTEAQHIEQRLADLIEHMENVIQKYLRNEFQSIEEYNREAGEVAEPFRVLVVANFPANFNEAAQPTLAEHRRQRAALRGLHCCWWPTSIAAAHRRAARGLGADTPRRSWPRRDASLAGCPTSAGSRWSSTRPPTPAAVTQLVHDGRRAMANEAGRVEVPFEFIAPPAEEIWTVVGQERHRRAAGPRRRHQLAAPAARQGHLAARAHRRQDGLGQVDAAARPDHQHRPALQSRRARVVPDRLQEGGRVQDLRRPRAAARPGRRHRERTRVRPERARSGSTPELKSRGDRFRAAGVQDLAGYREAEPTVPMPRILFIVDEFQEFFVEDDRVAQDAALLLDRLVRQGRAFGIHVLLGSQTLGGAYSLARSTLGPDGGAHRPAVQRGRRAPDPQRGQLGGPAAVPRRARRSTTTPTAWSKGIIRSRWSGWATSGASSIWTRSTHWPSSAVTSHGRRWCSRGTCRPTRPAIRC